jgi:hypothetical protein
VAGHGLLGAKPAASLDPFRSARGRFARRAAIRAYTLQELHETKRGQYLRKFARWMSVCALLVLAALAHAQQTDIVVGGSTLFSTQNSNASQTYLPPPERGGLYPSAGIDYIRGNHFGYSAEFAFRYKEGNYNDYQTYRPILYDINAVWAPKGKIFPARIAPRTSSILMAGFGGERVLYYYPSYNCGYPSGCSTHLDSNHFLFHMSAAANYRLWRKVFIRPEAHYYRIFNNTDDFHSNNILRLGVSVGYTFRD